MSFIHATHLNVINMNLKQTISIIVMIFLLSGLTPAILVNAEENGEKTEVEIACKEKRPHFISEEGEKSEYDKFIEKINKEDDSKLNTKAINKFLGDVQEQYHEYVQCIFNFAEDQILDSGGAKTRGTMQANAPAFPWFKPEAACIDEDKRKEVIKSSSPNELLPPIFKIYQEYSDMLNKIAPKYEQEGTESGKDGEILTLTQSINIKSSTSRKLRNYIDSEIQNSEIAMDITLTTLKELRMAFIMHVQFQCMLNNLEQYRKTIEKIRTIISSFPGALEGASMTK